MSYVTFTNRQGRESAALAEIYRPMKGDPMIAISIGVGTPNGKSEDVEARFDVASAEEHANRILALCKKIRKHRDLIENAMDDSDWSSGDVIAAYENGIVVLDDGLTIYNPIRAMAHMMGWSING